MMGSEFQQTSELASSLLSALKLETLSEGRRLTSKYPLDELERSLLAGLALVGSLKNSSRTVNSLPSPVLGHVFKFLQEQVEEADVPPNHWILVTHVCRHWRLVASETPSLWNRIHVHSNPRQVQYFLDKSQSLPLTVFCGSPVVKVEHSETLSMITSVARALRSICAHMARVQELYFFSSFPVDAVLQRDQFSRIVLPGISSRLPSNSLVSPRRNVDIFTQLFSSTSSNMRKLSLHGLPISYMLDSANQLNNLTHLALYEQPNWPANQPNFSLNLDAFLDILQATSQSLQSLTLIRAGPEGDMPREISKNDVPKRPAVSLPALISLEIGGWINGGNIAYFLAHLVIPGQAKRCIWGENLKYLSSILFPVDPDTAKTKCRGWDSEIKRVVFTALKGKDMVGIYSNAVYIQGRLDFLGIYPLFRDQPQIFESVEEVFFTPTSGRTALTAEEYQLLFDALPNVRRLLMVDMDISLVLQALGLFSQNTTSELALPELQEIDIQYSMPMDGFNDKSPAQDPLGNKYKISSLSALMALAKLCQRRHKFGYPLEKVKFGFGARRIAGDAHGDYAEISEYLLRRVEDLELADKLHTERGVKGSTDLVSSLLEGMWPSGASLGDF